MFSLSGRRMALVAVPPRILRVLTVFGVDEILPVFATVDAALADFREGTRPT
jgi:anti-anti-sigma regulatory factor